MRILLIIGCFSAFTSVAAATEHDWLIVPGQRVGPIVHDTNFDALQQELGADQLIFQPIDVGEGIFVDGWVLYPDDPFHRLEVTPSDYQSGLTVRISGERSRWQTHAGITLGRQLSVRMGPDPKVREDHYLAYIQVQGDHEYSSGHPAMQTLNPQIYQILVFLPDPVSPYDTP